MLTMHKKFPLKSHRKCQTGRSFFSSFASLERCIAWICEYRQTLRFLVERYTERELRMREQTNINKHAIQHQAQPPPPKCECVALVCVCSVCVYNTHLRLDVCAANLWCATEMKWWRTWIWRHFNQQTIEHTNQLIAHRQKTTSCTRVWVIQTEWLCIFSSLRYMCVYTWIRRKMLLVPNICLYSINLPVVSEFSSKNKRPEISFEFFINNIFFYYFENMA